MHIKLGYFWLVLSVMTLCEKADALDEQWICQGIQCDLGLPMESLDYLSTAPPEDAWAAYARLIDRGGRKAAIRLAQNLAVGDYLDQLTRDIPRETLRDNDRGEFLRLLGTVPAGWSVRILGKYLFDHRMTRQANGGGGTNCYNFAVDALAELRFPNAPTTPNDGSGNSRGMAEIEAWRKWWYANEDRIDELVHAINYD